MNKLVQQIVILPQTIITCIIIYELEAEASLSV